MIWFFINQMAAIVFKFALIAVVALRFRTMEYSFYHIVIRYIFWKDNKPIEWLYQNIYYLYYLGFIITQVIIELGLIHQLRMMKFEEKLPEFYISPIASLFLVAIFFHHFLSKTENAVETRNTIKRTLKNYIHKNK